MSEASPNPADLLVEWCSVRTTGSRGQFDLACLSLFGESIRPAEVLHRLEMVGHIEVDWTELAAGGSLDGPESHTRVWRTRGGNGLKNPRNNAPCSSGRKPQDPLQASPA